MEEVTLYLNCNIVDVTIDILCYKLVLKTQTTVERYLDDVLGAELHQTPWKRSAGFPNHLREIYAFRRAQILNQNFVLLYCADSEVTPMAMEKHVNWVQEKTDTQCVIVMETMVPHNRQRLIERKIPFIIPFKQMYLPDLGLDLREHLLKVREDVTQLVPVAQLVVLAKLLGRFEAEAGFNPTMLASQFAYTKMTMSRVINELKNLELVEATGSIKRPLYRFVVEGYELWKKALPYLRSPVTKRVYATGIQVKELHHAGLTALGELTMLVPPQTPMFAITSNKWNQFKKLDTVKTLPDAAREDAVAELEIWSYDPSVLSDGDFVDPLSLKLSFEHHTDERIEAAIEELMDGFKW